MSDDKYPGAEKFAVEVGILMAGAAYSDVSIFQRYKFPAKVLVAAAWAAANVLAEYQLTKELPKEK